MKTLRLVLAVLFFLFAVVQWNDPDPLLWIPVYLFTAGALGFAAYGHYQPWVTLAGLVITSIWAASYVPAFVDWIRMGMPSIVETMKAEKPFVELTREFLGLLLCAAALIWVYRDARKTARAGA